MEYMDLDWSVIYRLTSHQPLRGRLVRTSHCMRVVRQWSQPPAQRRHAEGGPIMILLEYTSILQFVFLDSSQVVHSRESAIMFSIHREGLTSRHFQQGKGLLSYCETSNSTNVRFQLYWRTSPLSVCTNANVAWHNSAVKLCARFPPNISQQHRVAPS